MSKNRAASIQQLAFMTGHWIGTIDGEPVEEAWSTPAGGVITGFFRWLKNGEVYLYEFPAIETEGKTLVLRIKHFNAGLVGWEERDQAAEFGLEWMKKLEVAFRQRDTEEFRRIIYRRVDKDTLVAIMQMNPDGSEKAEFVFKRR